MPSVPPPSRFTARHFYRILAAISVVALLVECFNSGNPAAIMSCLATFCCCLVAANDLSLSSALGMMRAARTGQPQKANDLGRRRKKRERG
jgi:hypothetical protein